MQQTKENVEKKQALTYEEMEAEREEVNMQFEVDFCVMRIINTFLWWFRNLNMILYKFIHFMLN